jgi:hypothetical protein
MCWIFDIRSYLMRSSWLKKWSYSTYPPSNPGKSGKTGEKLGISAGALIRPVKEEIITCRTLSQGCLHKIWFFFCSYKISVTICSEFETTSVISYIYMTDLLEASAVLFRKWRCGSNEPTLYISHNFIYYKSQNLTYID